MRFYRRIKDMNRTQNYRCCRPIFFYMWFSIKFPNVEVICSRACKNITLPCETLSRKSFLFDNGCEYHTIRGFNANWLS